MQDRNLPYENWSGMDVALDLLSQLQDDGGVGRDLGDGLIPGKPAVGFDGELFIIALAHDRGWLVTTLRQAALLNIQGVILDGRCAQVDQHQHGFLLAHAQDAIQGFVAGGQNSQVTHAQGGMLAARLDERAVMREEGSGIARFIRHVEALPVVPLRFPGSRARESRELAGSPTASGCGSAHPASAPAYRSPHRNKGMAYRVT